MPRRHRMSYLDTTRNVLHARIVYWGPAASGKTSTLLTLRRFLDPEDRYRLYSVAAADGSSLFFDVLPVEEFRFGSHRVRTRVIAVPGITGRTRARLALVKDADAIVFVADSRRMALKANRESAQELKGALLSLGIEPTNIPLVWAFNHQDQTDSIPAAELCDTLKVKEAPFFEAVATDGRGVFESFSEAFRLMVDSLVRRHRIEGADAEGAVPSRLLPQLVRGATRAGRTSQRPDDRHLVFKIPDTESVGTTQAIAAQVAMVEAHVQADANNLQLEGRNRELMAINRVARSILSAMEADNLLVVLLDSTAEYLNATHASCVLFDPADNGKLRTHVHGFGRDPALGLPPASAQKFFEFLKTSDGPVPVREDRNGDLLEALQRVDRRVKRALFQPVKSDFGKPAGWIGIYATADEPPLTSQQILFLSSISRLAALGVDKIGQLDRLQRASYRYDEEMRRRTGQLEMAQAKVRALNRGLESRVTERTRALDKANRKLRESHAGEVASARLRGMGELAASFAHEVNNPVAGLAGNLEFMQEALDELRVRVAGAGQEATDALKSIDEFGEIIQESAQSAERIAGIIASLKRLGGEESPQQTFSINALVADAVTLLEERTKAVAEMDLRLGMLPDVEGSSLEFGHVVLALITNALEALERKGEKGHIIVTSFPGDGKVTLMVKDDGVGIEKKLLSKVFEPFVSTKEGEPGAGVGLHTALKTVQALGGTIRLRSRPGEGTTATVELPVAGTAKTEAPAKESVA